MFPIYLFMDSNIFYSYDKLNSQFRNGILIQFRKYLKKMIFLKYEFKTDNIVWLINKSIYIDESANSEIEFFYKKIKNSNTKYQQIKAWLFS